MKEKFIYVLGYIYLCVSLIIFLLEFCRPIISIPLSILFIKVVYNSIKSMPNMSINLKNISKKKIMLIVGIILLWILISGVGGFIWQNQWDHKFRNALFMDLVNYKLPVVKGNEIICYYLGFWLPAVLGAKVSFSIQVGYFIQLIWAFIGVLIAFTLMCDYLKDVKIKYLMVLIFFSGLDIVYFLMQIFIFKDVNYSSMIEYLTAHIELGLSYFNSSSNTTLLFWLYNQIIPFWIGFMLLLKQDNVKYIGVIYALLVLYSPFPLMTLIFYALYKIIKTIRGKHLIRNFWNKVISFENIISFLIILVVCLYYKCNNSVNIISIIIPNYKILFKFGIFLFFEYGVYLIFLYKNNKNDSILKIFFVVTCLFSFVRMGISFDFAWRTCIPLTTYIMLLFMKEIRDRTLPEKSYRKLIIIFLLGAITPLLEFNRTFYNEYLVYTRGIGRRSDTLSSIFNTYNNERRDNFVGSKDSIFYKYIARK